MRKVSYLSTVIIILSFALIKAQTNSEKNARYFAENGSIVGYNIDRYNNRPLYINNTDAFVLTGDKLVIRFAHDQFLLGTFIAAIIHGDKGKWLQDCDSIISSYRSGRMTWKISDPTFPGLTVHIDVLPMANTIGMTARVRIDGAKKGDYLIWAYGGAKFRKGEHLNCALDVMGHPELLTWGFNPEECKNNDVKIKDNKFIISIADSTAKQKSGLTVVGLCNANSKPAMGDASVWKNFSAFAVSSPQKEPIIKGIADLENGKDIYWAFETFASINAEDLNLVNAPEKAFTDGVNRTNEFLSRLKISTPDPYLNAMAQASVSAVDGTWYPPVFVHGAMQWNIPFPGWRTIFGGTMLGWHDRVKTEAMYYIGYQINESDKKNAKADTNLLLTIQDTASRFYGAGYVNKDQGFYDMQTQFFDQIIEEWRWTADPSLEQFLRPALELHLARMRDCFDPDGDGVYESYLNTWPTDSQWYNGGGTAEETSYAYRGHCAARDMAHRVNDTSSVNYHTKMMEKIKNGFFTKLWIYNKGYSGAYREQGGHNRLHEDPWLYSIFLPIDAHLTSPLQAIESVYYSEWALQNDRIALGGRMIWTSNWVPSIWSVREMWPGDNYALALSYFQAGMPDDAWEILRGTFMNSGFGGVVPGNFGSYNGGTDFADCKDTFVRTLVEGMFGYNPDYPNNLVNIIPQFPSGWNHASIELPDVKIAFQREGRFIRYNIELAAAAKLNLCFPVQSKNIETISVNGKPVSWKVLPGAGCSIVQIRLPASTKEEINIKTGQQLPYYTPVKLAGNISGAIKLEAKDAKIVEFYDSQKVLENGRISNGVVTAKLAENKGFHTVVAKVLSGKINQWRVFRIKVNDPVNDAVYEAKFVDNIPANASWENIDISRQLNADVCAIYKQKYLSPRPNTVSLRIGTDGYSPWTFPIWNRRPPIIKLDLLNKLVDDKNILTTPQKVPFNWSGDQKNIAFTSLWENFPKKITIPVEKKGEAVWFLIAGSTNPMQCRISNAVIRLHYADGKTDSLELIPPLNYWNLSIIGVSNSDTSQYTRNDYKAETDKFCLPNKPPETVRLGENCRAMLLNLKLRKGVLLKNVTLEALSQEVVVGLIGVTVMNPE